MNARHFCSLITGIVLLTGQAIAQPPNGEEEEGLLTGLAGRIFAVDAEIVFSLNPEVPAGTRFENCYAFLDDHVWIDPLFPDFLGGSPGVPGTWIQHTELPKIEYTVTVVDVLAAGGPLLTQRGAVTPGRGKADGKLVTYTTVWLFGSPVVDVESRGREISYEEAETTCPGNLSNLPL